MREDRFGVRNVVGRVKVGSSFMPDVIRRCFNTGKSPSMAARILRDLIVDVVREIRRTRLQYRTAKSKPSLSSAVSSAFWFG